jgi:hypothetical protein
MPVRTRKIGVNDKDKSALALDGDDFRRHWVSDEAGGSRNTNPKVAFNKQDNGFEHLHLTDVSLASAETNDAPDFSNFGSDEEARYYGILRSKLSLAKDYILKEKVLSLDPDRVGLRHEPTSLALAAPPMMIDLHSQQMVRLLIDAGVELRRVGAYIPDDQIEAVLGEPMRDYLEFWERLRRNLSWQLPGQDDDNRMGQTDRVMDEVLEKLVEP